MLWIQNNFDMLCDLKTDAFEHCRHIYSYEFEQLKSA